MKKFTLLACLFVLLNACSGGDEAEGVSCGNVSGLTISQQANLLNYSFASTSAASYYELSFVMTNNGSTPDSGYRVSVNTTTGSIDVAQAGSFGSYSVYVRAICGDSDSYGDWSAATMLTTSDYCEKPTDIEFTPFSNVLRWDPENYGTNINQYQVQYGISGFALGSGTSAQTTYPELFGVVMQAQTAYDFYVRSNCSGAQGWSDWAGPYTYYSGETGVNLCNAPTAVGYTITSTSGTSWNAEFTYNENGVDTFEYALMNTSATPTDAQLSTVTSGYRPAYVGLNIYTTYKFWLRGVCQNGNRTAWTTITVTH